MLVGMTGGICNRRRNWGGGGISARRDLGGIVLGVGNLEEGEDLCSDAKFEG